jgi:hypothetical protein
VVALIGSLLTLPLFLGALGIAYAVVSAVSALKAPGGWGLKWLVVATLWVLGMIAMEDDPRERCSTAAPRGPDPGDEIVGDRV